MLTASLCEVSLLGGKTEELQISHVAIYKGRIQLKMEPFKSLHEQRFKGQDGWLDEEQKRCWMLKLRAG